MPVESLQQLLSWNPGPQTYLIDSGILVPETIMVIFGAPGSWKSITAVHTAFVLSEGSDWLGHKTKQSTTFVYQVEMPRAVQWRRISKYSCALQQNCNHSNLFFETSLSNQIDNSYGFAALEKSVNEVRARSPNSHLVVFLDPMSKLMGGSAADELDTKKFINNVDLLRARYGCTVVIVHHSRKLKTSSDGEVIDLGAEDMFGGELIKWCDTAIRTKVINPFAGSNRVQFQFVKTRHAETFINNLEVEWNKQTLIPTITRELPGEDGDRPSEPTVRDLK